MTHPLHLPKHVSRLAPTDTFNFSCHKDVKCFTDCCRMLELALTPYDALRLRRATCLTSTQLLDDYIIIEQEPGEPFPRFYLTMVDDGRASCVFVADHGCTVYQHRPAACRAYPLGRAVIRNEHNILEEHFVLMQEEHCQGFQETVEQNALQYSVEQELVTYNIYNDAVAAILQHDSIRKGFIPTTSQIDLFVLALYNIDMFREMLLDKRLDAINRALTDQNHPMTDEELLLFAINWLAQQLFGPF